MSSEQRDSHQHISVSSHDFSAKLPPLLHGAALAQSKPPIQAKEPQTNPKEVHFGWFNWAVLIVYFLGMLYLGGLFFRKGDHPDDFFKGGGRIPWWAASISIFATMFSAITYMTIPAKVYATNWTYYPIQFMMLFILYPVVKYYLPFFRRLNVTTAYAYLQCRFNYALRCMASLLFMAFMVARMALILFLPALALSAVADIDISLCILLMAVITIIYCTLGGIEAVIWADVIQGIILVGGAILAAIYLIWQTPGGFQGFVDIGMNDHKFVLFDWSLDYRSATFWVVILGGLANNLISYTSDQTIIQRYMTTKDERSAARSIVVNGVICVVVSIVFYLIGTGLYTFFKTHPEAGEKVKIITVTDPEVTRFFMTIPEACQLVLQAGAIGIGGEIFVFDMGESVKIVDLARNMIRLSGFEVGKDIQIVFTGLRPGEKLYEEVLSKKEEVLNTYSPGAEV